MINPKLTFSRGVAAAGIQGTPELWVKQEKELVEHLSVDVQQDYGRDYLLGAEELPAAHPFVL